MSASLIGVTESLAESNADKKYHVGDGSRSELQMATCMSTGVFQKCPDTYHQSAINMNALQTC